MVVKQQSDWLQVWSAVTLKQYWGPAAVGSISTLKFEESMGLFRQVVAARAAGLQAREMRGGS